MAEENARTLREKREAAADEALFAMLDGVSAFFEGRATLHITSMQPGIGQGVRFIKDPATK